MSNENIWATFIGVTAFVLGGALGSLTMKWATDDDVRKMRAQNYELAENGRRLAAAAYVCMDHCGAAACGADK